MKVTIGRNLQPENRVFFSEKIITIENGGLLFLIEENSHGELIINKISGTNGLTISTVSGNKVKLT